MKNRVMKDSGVEWIGAIPEDWKILKYKRFAKSGMGSTLLKEDVLINEEPNSVPIYSATQTDKQFGYLQNPKIVLEKGDLVIPARGNSIGNTKIIKEAIATCTQTTIYSKLNNKIDNRFLYYCSIGLKEHWFFFVQTAIPQITVAEVQNNLVPFTSLKEQQKIAAFLDEKVAHIDNIIEDTKKSIRDLKIYKQSFITEVVTKGLDSSVDMQDSGVEYIGKIPSHWKFSKFKYLLTSPLKYGANESGVVYDDSKPRYIRITDILEGNKLINSNRQSLDEDKAKEYILKDGDLLFARSGATAGKTYMVNKNTPRSAFAGYLIKADVGDVDVSNYVYYYTLSKSYEEWKNSVVIQATIQNIGAEKYGDMFLPIPPKNEQIDIVEYLNKKVESIDLILEDKKLLLSEFESYKKALIYEYVTGKKEVK